MGMGGFAILISINPPFHLMNVCPIGEGDGGPGASCKEMLVAVLFRGYSFKGMNMTIRRISLFRKGKSMNEVLVFART